MLPGLGRMPVNRSPWQVSHRLQLKGKEKWAPKVLGYIPPCQMAAPLQAAGQEDEQRAGTTLSLKPGTDENSPCALLQSPDQGMGLEDRN